MCQGKKLFQKIRRTFFGMAITRKYSTHNGNSNFDQDQETLKRRRGSVFDNVCTIFVSGGFSIKMIRIAEFESEKD